MNIPKDCADEWRSSVRMSFYIENYHASANISLSIFFFNIDSYPFDLVM